VAASRSGRPAEPSIRPAATGAIRDQRWRASGGHRALTTAFRHRRSIALAQPLVNRGDRDRTGNVWRDDLVGPAVPAGTAARWLRSIGPADGVARALGPLMVS
jgi:hypothetical protein